MQGRKGFTLVELMVVILIIGILAAVSVPIMRGRIDSAKWSEANNACGTIRTSVRAYVSEKGPNYPNYSEIEGSLAASGSVASLLGFGDTDLDSTYFNQGDYVISNVQADPPGCVITVTSSHADGPTGTGTMAANGSWTIGL